jgi:hypothetical protein
MTDRAFAIHYARVMLAEASRRRRGRVNRNFYWTLFADAQRARREAAAMRDVVQGELFA